MIDPDFSRRIMDLALIEAVKGRGGVEPNPMVGAVVVRGGEVVGRGHHARFGGPHAEVMALQEAGADARGASLYVTLEPCCHYGKTPPCTDAIIRAGVAQVFAAIRDPFPRVDGGGLAILRGAGIKVDLGILAGPAAELNAAYLKRVSTGLPYVTAKYAMTLDGKTAVASGQSQWISSSGSRKLVHELRGRMDAIVVGTETVLADNPSLTARPAGLRTAVRVVMDSRARLPLESQLVQTAGEVPVLVAVSQSAPAEHCQALRDRGCEVVVFPAADRVDVVQLLAELGKRSVTNVLVEGGGRVLGSFFDAGQVDELDAYVAPIVEGGDHRYNPVRGSGSSSMADATRVTRVSFAEIEGDMRIRGIIIQPWRSILSDLGRDPATRPEVWEFA